ncbi:MAG: Quinoprotein glucose dehydrogenase [Crocinitomicaceae bacterium]|jgi:glucose/arabinose dehydrogenase|nr:Quinoprotein glucose dehydrogenase [Crocinitomicaceae bacterium]
MKKIYISLLILLPLNGAFSQSTLMIGNTEVTIDTVYTGLDVPWEIQYGPDGNLWFTERKGLVSKLDPVTKTRTIVLDIVDDVYQEYEAGLLGMALHPDFENTPEVFIVYTYGTSPNVLEKLVKYTYNGTALVNPVIVLDNITAYTTHNGSRLLFLPDNTLLMSTGDAQDQPAAQDLSSLNGKILRLNMDGSIPADNPSPTSYVYTFGHRNIQGLNHGPNDRIYISEHGPTTDDEFQLLLPDRNYGWPDVEGYCDLPAEQSFCGQNNVEEPLMAWTPTIAPSDLIYYDNDAFPELDDKILMTVLKDKKVRAITLNVPGNHVMDEEDYFTDMFGRLRDIAMGPQKELYLATNGAEWMNIDPNTHSIIRITPPTDASLGELDNTGFQMYPNPAKNLLTIEVKAVDLGSDCIIRDLQGKEIQQQKITSPKFMLDLTKLEKGVYLVEMNGVVQSLIVN